MMKITVFNGSPRGVKSNTHFMVKEFLSGAQSAGAETENIFLIKQKIGLCMGCFDCWTKTPGVCIQKDDMQKLLEKFISSDIVVFAFPLYVDNVSGLMKLFMDRMIPILDPHFELDENGEVYHKKRYGKYPLIVVISNCGFPEQTNFQVVHLLFKRIARNMHSKVIAEIYRGGGEILHNDIVFLKPLINKYKKILRKAGTEIVSRLQLSEKTVAELEKPIIPHKHYIKGGNRHWDKLLS